MVIELMISSVLSIGGCFEVNILTDFSDNFNRESFFFLYLPLFFAYP